MTPLALFQHVIVWLPLVIGGIFLIRAGLKGRRINDHPICRRCRFDLIGLTGSNADPNSHPDRCPECGTSLAGTTRRARRAIIDGERKRRWWAIWLGVVLLLGGLVTGFWLTYKPLAKFPWTTWAPDWVLAEMVDSPNTARADMVIREMFQRLQHDDLSRRSLGRSVRQILKRQADPATPWLAIGGTLVEAGRAKGFVTDDQWASYAANTYLIDVQFPDTIFQNRPMYYDLTVATRKGDLWMRGAPPEVRLTAVIDEQYQLHGESMTSRISPSSPSSPAPSRMFAFLPGLPPGTHEGRVDFDVQVFSLADRDLSGSPTKLLARRAVALPFTVDVLPADGETRLLVSPTEQEAAMRRCFDVDGLTADSMNFDVCGLFEQLHVVRPPVGYAFSVHLRTDTGETLLAEISGTAGSEAYHRMVRRGPIVGLDHGRRVDIVFRPSVDVARSTKGLEEIWGEEIVVRNVPIGVLVD